MGQQELDLPSPGSEVVTDAPGKVSFHGKAELIVQDDGQGITKTHHGLVGWRVYAVVFALCLTLFLTVLEATIVSTSLVSITNSLNGFRDSSWIITGYLLTYNGFLTIGAKISDVFGRKSTSILSLVVFVAFSAACGAAQSITQLIVFRALQGVGASSAYAICQNMIFDIATPAQVPVYGMIISLTFTLAAVLGPTLGGVINNASRWRWVFLLNIPAASIAAVILLILIPRGFPGPRMNVSGSVQDIPVTNKEVSVSVSELAEETRKQPARWRRLDFLGAFLLLTATVLMVTAFEEAEIRYPWKSPFVIVLLVVSIFFWIGFFLWERNLSQRNTVCEPVFPWQSVRRDYIGMLLNSFFVGGPVTITIFLIPQRFAIVNGCSPLQAAIRVLPFSILVSIGSVLAMVAGKKMIPPIYILMTGSVFQILGYSLLTTLPQGTTIEAAEYGYLVLAAMGSGANIAMLIAMVPWFVSHDARSVAVSAVSQFRWLGAVTTLAIAASVLNLSLESRLAGILSPSQVQSLLQQSAQLLTYDAAVQDRIRTVFAESYSIPARIVVGLAVAQLPCSLIMWRKQQVIMKSS